MVVVLCLFCRDWWCLLRLSEFRVLCGALKGANLGMSELNFKAVELPAGGSGTSVSRARTSGVLACKVRGKVGVVSATCPCRDTKVSNGKGDRGFLKGCLGRGDLESRVLLRAGSPS